MPVDDLWYSSRRGPDGERLPTKRHGRGKRWRTRWVDDTGQDRSRLYDKKSDAERFDASVRASVHAGQYVDPTAGKETLAAYSQAWRGQQLWDVATAERAEKAFRTHIVPILGRLPMSQVRTSHIKGWVKDRSAVLAPSTQKVVYGYLVSMFGAAVLDRVIGSSPCNKSVTLPEIEHTDLFVPTVEQIDALAAALPARYAAQPRAAGATGLRQGELWGLELDHVDFLRREIRVEQQMKVVSRRRPFLAPPKTKLSRRTVELSQVGAEALARHIELFPPVEVEIDDETDPRKPVRRTAKLIFTNSRGCRSTAATGPTSGCRRWRRPACPPGSAFTGCGTSTLRR